MNFFVTIRIARDQDKVPALFDKPCKPGRGFLKIEIEVVRTGGAYDFIEQLAHHYGQCRRIVHSRLRDMYIFIHGK